MSRMTARMTAAGVATILALGGAAACSDEDGDGATTDEELQDVRDGANEAEEQIQNEVDGQDQGSNQDGE